METMKDKSARFRKATAFFLEFALAEKGSTPLLDPYVPLSKQEFAKGVLPINRY